MNKCQYIKEVSQDLKDNFQKNYSYKKIVLINNYLRNKSNTTKKNIIYPIINNNHFVQ